MPDVDERLITGETIVRTTSKHWIAPLGDAEEYETKKVELLARL